MLKATAVLTALLTQANLQPVHTDDALHYRLSVCQEPRLEYWQERCRRSWKTRSGLPSVRPTATPSEQSMAKAPRPPLEQPRDN